MTATFLLISDLQCLHPVTPVPRLPLAKLPMTTDLLHCTESPPLRRVSIRDCIMPGTCILLVLFLSFLKPAYLTIAVAALQYNSGGSGIVLVWITECIEEPSATRLNFFIRQAMYSQKVYKTVTGSKVLNT